MQPPLSLTSLLMVSSRMQLSHGFVKLDPGIPDLFIWDFLLLQVDVSSLDLGETSLNLSWAPMCLLPRGIDSRAPTQSSVHVDNSMFPAAALVWLLRLGHLSDSNRGCRLTYRVSQSAGTAKLVGDPESGSMGRERNVSTMRAILSDGEGKDKHAKRTARRPRQLAQRGKVRMPAKPGLLARLGNIEEPYTTNVRLSRVLHGLWEKSRMGLCCICYRGSFVPRFSILR